MNRKVLITASVFSHIRSFHLPYLKAFHENGIQVHVACGGTPCDLPEADRIVSLPLEKKLYSPSNLRAVVILNRLMREEQYDLIITHTSLAAFYTRLAVNRIIPRPKVIYMCHGYLFDDQSSLSRRFTLLQAERVVAGRTDLLLTMNAYDHNLAKAYHLGKEIAMIPGVGVDFAKLDAECSSSSAIRQQLRLPEGAFVLFYAAEFSNRKNQAFLIHAMEKLPDHIYLVLAGEGDNLASCKELAARLHVSDRVLFPGHVQSIGNWYAMADLAVSASRSEGLPFNIMEAMHFGLPVVATDVKGNADLIENQTTGMLFPFDDEASYIDSVLQLSQSSLMYERISAAAKNKSSYYDLERVFPHVWRHYTDFLPC